MQTETRITAKVGNQRVTIGCGISVLGGLLFILGLGQILPGTSPDSTTVSRCLLQMAGWVVFAGWLIQRGEAGLLPFPRHRAFSPFKAIKSAFSEYCLPLALLLLLFTGTVLLVGLLVAPLVLFVFQKLF